MFRFNFHCEADDSGKHEPAESSVCEGLPAREHDLRESVLSREHLLGVCSVSELAGGVTLSLVSAELVLAGGLGVPAPPLLAEAANCGTDLMAGRYEGGLRVWEGCWDLVRAMADARVSVAGRRVAELGCGAAIPGLWALRRGAASLLLQDYNPEVLDTLTVANVLLNAPGDERGRCRLFSGDWGALARRWRRECPGSVDLLLTAETIYNASGSGRLLDAVDALLSPAGQCLVAAKTVYFGVGGGTRQFEQQLLRRGGFLCQPLFSTDSGLQREVLLITRQTFATSH